MNYIINYLKESLLELKKVSWPSRKEVVNLVLTIIAAVVIAGIIVGAIDFLFSGIIKLLSTIR